MLSVVIAVAILGFDVDPGKVDKLQRGESYIGHIPADDIRSMRERKFEATSQFARLSEPDTRAATQSKASKDALGLSLQPLTPAEARERGLGDRTGVLVRGVQDGSPAANAGLQPGDVITEINRAPVRNIDDVKQAMDKQGKDKPALFLVHRNGTSVYLAVNPSTAAS